jgi:hypothetical protein
MIFDQYIPFLLEKATFYKKAKKSIFNISLFYKAIGMDNVDLIMRRYISLLYFICKRIVFLMIYLI